MATLVPRSCLTLCFMLSLLTLALPGPILAKNCGGPVPCECGDFLVASRTLVAGVDFITVTPCPDIGLSIWVSDLTLDLNGNTIRAAAGAGSYGIALNTSSGITVTGGTIVGFGYSGSLPPLGPQPLLVPPDRRGGRRHYHPRRCQHDRAERVPEGQQGTPTPPGEGPGPRQPDRGQPVQPAAGARVLIDRSDPILPDLGPTVIARNVILKAPEPGWSRRAFIPRAPHRGDPRRSQPGEPERWQTGGSWPASRDDPQRVDRQRS